MAWLCIHEEPIGWCAICLNQQIAERDWKIVDQLHELTIARQRLAVLEQAVNAARPIIQGLKDSPPDIARLDPLFSLCDTWLMAYPAREAERATQCENGDCADHYGDREAWCDHCKSAHPAREEVSGGQNETRID